MGKILGPALFLFFLSPLLAELLSGAAPPVRFFDPVWGFPLILLYGSGAIIIRELVQRWNKGIPSLLLLGMAYGILEEGIALKTFFDPNWPLIGILGSYGRAFGINWVWSIELPIGHAIFSMAIPILLTELLFPDERPTPWVDDNTFKLLSALFAAEVAGAAVFFATYPVPFVPYAMTLLIAGLLAAIARRLPRPIFAPPPAGKAMDVPGPLTFWLIGFFSAIALIIIHFSLPHTGIPPLGTIAIFLLFLAGDAFLLLRLSGNGGTWSDLHEFALIAGVLSVLILYAPVQEFLIKKSLPLDTTGMGFVGAVFAVFLLWAWGKIRSRTS